MAVHRSEKWNDGAPHAFPRLWPLFLGEACPRWRSFKESLNVGLPRVRLLFDMPWKTTIAIDTSGGFHGCGRITQVLEHGRFPVLINDPIPLKDDSGLVLAARVPFGQVRVLFNTEVE